MISMDTPEEPDLMVYADEGQISQILINLIKNALQAGAKHVTITGKMGKEDDVILRHRPGEERRE